MSDNSSLSLSPGSQGYPEEEFIDDFLVEAQEYLERIEELILDLEVKPDDKEIINSLFRYFHTTKGLAGFIEQRDIQEIAHKIETIMEQCRKGLRMVDRWVIDRILVSVDLIKRVMECLSVRRSIYCMMEIEAFLKEDVGSQPAKTPPPPSKAAPKPQPKPEKAKQPEVKVSQEAPPQTPLPQKPETSLDKEPGKSPPSEPPSEPLPKPTPPPPSSQEKEADLRVTEDLVANQHTSMSLDKTDQLVELLGEMLVIQSQVEMEAQNRLPTGDPLLNIIARMCHVGREIQNYSMTMRKIPIQAIFDEISRSNPDWLVTVDGRDTLIDLHMVEGIEGFLSRWIAHLIEIKVPDEEGFFEDSIDSIHFRCSDHGQFTLLECFIPKTFATNQEPDHEVLPAPLRDELKALGAKIDHRDEEDLSQPLAIKLPSQQTILNGTILKMMGTAYVIPTMHVKQIYQPKAEDWLSVKGQEEMIMIRSQIIPVIPIHTIFQSHQSDLPSQSPLVMILEWEKQYMALPVEDVMDRREIAVKPMDHHFQGLDFVLGASILGDGKVALILDVECFFQHLHDSKRIQEEKR